MTKPQNPIQDIIMAACLEESERLKAQYITAIVDVRREVNRLEREALEMKTRNITQLGSQIERYLVCPL